MVTAAMIYRDTPLPGADIAGKSFNAITATALGASAMRAHLVTTSMMTPPLSISAMP